MSDLHTILVIIQATPFCNINCRYCYLPDRLSKKRISFETLSKIAERLFESPFVADEVTIVWHAGEPLVLPISFYEEAHAVIQRHNTHGVKLVWSIQTNATLITNEWCDFFKRHNVRVGVSLDGPENVHDASRIDRAGRGTFNRAMRGVHLMREAGLRPGVIAVVTADALSYPEEIWQLFLDNGVGHIGFNPEEVEGFNAKSSMHREGIEESYRLFLKQILTLRAATPSPPALREYDSALRHIRSGVNQARGQDNVPMAIINFDCDGNISTFSPELLTARHEPYGNFIFGNVYEHSLEQILQTDKFIQINSAIQQGVQECRDTCDYFMFCGGGSPSNKIAETGTFATTETQLCRQRIKVTVDAILDHLEEHMELGPTL